MRIMPRTVQPSVWTGRAPVDHEVTLQCRYEREKQQFAFETAEERSSFVDAETSVTVSASYCGSSTASQRERES